MGVLALIIRSTSSVRLVSRVSGVLVLNAKRAQSHTPSTYDGFDTRFDTAERRPRGSGITIFGYDAARLGKLF